MSRTDIHISAGFDPHAAQFEIWQALEEVRFVVAACGRRMGKSVLGRAVMGKYALDGKRVAYMAPTNKMLTQMWRDTKAMLHDVIAEKNEQEHRLDLITEGVTPGGKKDHGVIEFWSLDNPDGPRGREYDLIVVDEAAVLPSIDIWNDVLLATLGTRKGKALFLSTPRGLNWFWDIFLRGRDPRYPLWRSFQKPTVCNPHFDVAELAEIKRSVPTRTWEQEYLADFKGDGGDVFRNIDECATALWQQNPTPGHAYVMGVDFARVEDYSCVDVFDCTLHEQCYLDRTNDIEYELQKGRILALVERFRPLCVIVEDNSVGGVVEQLERANVPVVRFHTSNPTKLILVDTLAVGLERADLKILNPKQPGVAGEVAQIQIDELRSYRPTQLPSGLVRYSAPEGRHDDTVMALMLSYYAAATQAAGEAELVRWSA